MSYLQCTMWSTVRELLFAERSEGTGEPVRPQDKSAYQKIIFLISQPKHMLWVLKRTGMMRRF